MSNMFNLSFVLAKAEFKLRNEGSYLGLLWYLLNPLFTFVLLLFIFQRYFSSGVEHYPLYLLLGIVVFNFFQQATTEATQAIHENKWIIKSIFFPRESLVFAIVIKTFFSNIFEIVLFGFFLVLYNVSIIGLLFYPIFMFFFCIFVVGVSLLLSAITVFFNDFNNVWNFIVRLVWLGTPIFYTINDQPQLLFLNIFNPLYYFITIARDIIIYMKIPEQWLILGALFYSLLFFSLGWFIFRKVKHKFSELI